VIKRSVERKERGGGEVGEGGEWRGGKREKDEGAIRPWDFPGKVIGHRSKKREGSPQRKKGLRLTLIKTSYGRRKKGDQRGPSDRK